MSFDLESREFNGKWYTDVKASKIEPVNTNSQQISQVQQTQQTAPTFSAPNELPQEFDSYSEEGVGDDLPF
jgi:hypothetical protein